MKLGNLLGTVVGYHLGLLTGTISFLRNARMFHHERFTNHLRIGAYSGSQLGRILRYNLKYGRLLPRKNIRLPHERLSILKRSFLHFTKENL